MRALKFKLNHIGNFQPEHSGSPLGHPVYQVESIPEDIGNHTVLNRLNTSVLVSGREEVIFDFKYLGAGQVVHGRKQ